MKKTFYFLFCLCLLSSCLSDPEPVRVDNLDNEIGIKLSQNPTLNGPEISFELSSIDLFDCNDASIQSSILLDGERLILNIEEIHIPEYCVEGDLSANGKASIELENGNYKFEVRLGENSFELGNVYTDEDIFLLSNFNEAAGLTSSNSLVHKLPHNHIWGTLDITNSVNEIGTQFFDQIGEFTSKSTEIQIGDYGLFNIESLTTPGATITPLNFMIYKADNLEGVREFLNEFRSENADVIINLQHSSGEIL